MPRTPAEPPIDAAKADVGLVCALPMELDPFFRRFRKSNTIKGGGFRFRGGTLRGVRVAAVESGPGAAKAARATAALIDGHAPAWIVACGFAGALREGMKIGDLVVAEAVRELDGDEIATPSGMPADASRGLHVGRFVTTPGIVRTVAEKRELAERYDALAVDMETFAVATAARAAGVPFMAVRSITDGLAADLPVEVHALLSATGTKRVGATLGALWNRPESGKDLWRLRETAHHAADRLAPFLAGVVEQLHAATARK